MADRVNAMKIQSFYTSILTGRQSKLSVRKQVCTDQPDFSFVSESKSDEVQVKQMWKISKKNVEIMQFYLLDINIQ